ncbi:Helix-turn-helix [Tardiphaga sp. OK246]|jgi:transcriptional regulator with XRE-family HTH domain|uniref:helix-turn-helix domain-containing protein n=1 Tax=Tardiphaga sp. OK246 TaxID=1855307 RepID=UPI000B634A5D|nr:helix-turn-helix transcriptional regulator [Tardiphaga sp. OK246]SNS45777.1 Helix-turn-helix [Tardiphaga sp. OK246]
MQPRHANEVDVHIGKRLRMRRLMMNMSQEALANEIGLTFQQVQKYEKGANRISAGRMQQIAAILKVPVTFLYDGLQNRGGAVSEVGINVIEQFLSTKDGLALITAFSQVEDRKLRQSIVDLVKTIVAEHKPKKKPK